MGRWWYWEMFVFDEEIEREVKWGNGKKKKNVVSSEERKEREVKILENGKHAKPTKSPGDDFGWMEFDEALATA